MFHFYCGDLELNLHLQGHLCLKACCYFQALRGLEKSQAHCLRAPAETLKKNKTKNTVFIGLLLGLY